MLMKRRISPFSSTSRSRSPGYWRSRSSINSPTVSAVTSTSAEPLVIALRGVGMRTRTAILGLLVSPDLNFTYLTLGRAECQRRAALPPSRGRAHHVSSAAVTRAWLAPVLLLTYAVAFARTALGSGLLVFDDHPGQLYRIAHALTVGLEPWRLNPGRSEEHTSELQSQFHLVCRLLLEKKKH